MRTGPGGEHLPRSQRDQSTLERHDRDNCRVTGEFQGKKQGKKVIPVRRVSTTLMHIWAEKQRK